MTAGPAPGSWSVCTCPYGPGWAEMAQPHTQVLSHRRHHHDRAGTRRSTRAAGNRGGCGPGWATPPMWVDLSTRHVRGRATTSGVSWLSRSFPGPEGQTEA